MFVIRMEIIGMRMPCAHALYGTLFRHEFTGIFLRLAIANFLPVWYSIDTLPWFSTAIRSRNPYFDRRYLAMFFDQSRSLESDGRLSFKHFVSYD